MFNFGRGRSLFIFASQLPPNDGVSDQIRIEGPPAGVQQAKTAIEAILKKLADSKVGQQGIVVCLTKSTRPLQSIDIIVEQRFHSQLIGAKGSNIKEIIEKFGGISINFPDSGKTSDIITFVVWILLNESLKRVK